MMRQQTGNFAAQSRVAAAGIAQVCVALRGLALQRSVEDFFNLLAAFHRRLPANRSVPGTATLGSNSFTPFTHDRRYASTAQRERRLWREFDQPPADPHDRYYCRILANSPDPLPEPAEPELPIDAEEIRVIVPDQPADDSGWEAMQELQGPSSGVHFLVPLPKHIDETALELFGFYKYELRLGQDRSRWCTAHGRWGPPLPVTGA